MPTNPFVALSAPAALGATLLGISATLLAVDIGGTIALDAGRSGSVPARDGVAASFLPSLAPRTLQPVTERPAQSVAPPPAQPQTPARGSIERPVVAVVRRSIAENVAHHEYHTARKPPVVAKRAILLRQPMVVARLPAAAQPMPVKAVAKAAHRKPRDIASLRDVRRFVIRELAARSARECAISATAYTAADGHVIVDLVMRNRKARWTEKAVVRRNGTRLKLLGDKAHALPFVTLASADIKPGR